MATNSTLFSPRVISLVVLTLQTTIFVLILRYSRTSQAGATRYLSSTAVLLAEIVKIIINMFMIHYNNNFNFSKSISNIRREILSKPLDTLKVSVPALLYTVQNNLLFLALSNLDAATYQVTYQLKILATAIFSVILMGKKLNPLKWFALVQLTCGIALVQLATNGQSSKSTSNAQGSPTIGLIAVLCACLTSGFSGVYFEMILKGSAVSLWMRNLQLGGFSILCSSLGILFNDWHIIRAKGFFYGYNYLTWIVVILQAVGGLIVANVVKYADNILKGFAAAVSILLMGYISWIWLQDFTPTTNFFVGTGFVITSTYLYSL
ncbi:UDP-N-acetylglucosamine transporter [Trichoplax sp. H2]|uniref:UDP-N-acetylglucosamine transporter n=1 Tax=Trichoplax adhaerens TaxID=10228 RepID=B3RNG5_TRIAD|nr:hypothetical protein TRIADDRAFT_21640 [Trichoplax adhaerens]EDV28018.1 hypothetical protein TRIADDRAFT_21640 [Trichoplax adhaerens]RDD44440.1 UDP-N-acetylglucosamine transporter [Trichoplax sp. H2]|eukprot:XP_002109852.1 hypothetical protein TRIADDRAFT_21640 [Trichoplax adhaerens]